MHYREKSQEGSEGGREEGRKGRGPSYYSHTIRLTKASTLKSSEGPWTLPAGDRDTECKATIPAFAKAHTLLSLSLCFRQHSLGSSSFSVNLHISSLFPFRVRSQAHDLVHAKQGLTLSSVSTEDEVLSQSPAGSLSFSVLNYF